MWWKWIRPYSFLKRESTSGSQSSDIPVLEADYPGDYTTSTPVVKPITAQKHYANPVFEIQNESKYKY